jgi:hypothetical protein
LAREPFCALGCMADAKRRGRGEDDIYFDRRADCRDKAHHKTCAGRWRGVVSLGFSADGNGSARRSAARPRLRSGTNSKNSTPSWTRVSGPATGSFPWPSAVPDGPAVGIDVASLLTSFGALGVVVLLLLTGILVTGWAYRKLEAENHTYRNALQVERQHPGSHKPCRRVPDGGLKRVPPELRRFVEDGDFIAAHWTPGEDGCTCHMFDPATNLCTAQHRTGSRQCAGTIRGTATSRRRNARHACCLGVRTSPTSSRRTGPMAPPADPGDRALTPPGPRRTTERPLHLSPHLRFPAR